MRSTPYPNFDLFRDPTTGVQYFSPDRGKTFYLYVRESNSYRQDVIFRKDLNQAFYYVPERKGWYVYDVAKNLYLENRELNAVINNRAQAAKRQADFPKNKPFEHFLACASELSALPGYTEIDPAFAIPKNGRYADGKAMYLMTVSPSGETVVAHRDQVGFLTPKQGEVSALRDGPQAFRYNALDAEGKAVTLEWNVNLKLKPADRNIAENFGATGTFVDIVDGRPAAPRTETSFKKRLDKDQWARPGARFLSAFASTVSKLTRWAKGNQVRSEAIQSKVESALKACAKVPGAKNKDLWAVPFVDSQGKVVEKNFFASLSELYTQTEADAKLKSEVMKPSIVDRGTEKPLAGQVTGRVAGAGNGIVRTSADLGVAPTGPLRAEPAK